MAAHGALAAAHGARNEDLLDARDASHERDSDVARATEGDVPKTHPARLLAMSGAAAGASHTAAAAGTTDHPHNPYHRYLSHNHHLHLHLHDHKPHPQTPPNASEASTPSRTRSESSSLYTFPSTLPSTTPVHTTINKPGFHVIDTGVDDTDTPDDGHPPAKDKTSPSPDGQVRADSPHTDPAPRPHQTPLSAPPPASLQSQARRRRQRNSGVSQKSLRDSYSQSQRPLPPTHSEEARQDLGWARESEAQGEAVIDYRGDSEAATSASEQDRASDTAGIEGAGINGSEVGSLNSHTLAWDQTRLRIVYLVSTIMAPSASVPADAAAVEAAAGAAEAPQEASLSASAAPVPLPACDELASQEASEVGHYMERCPKGWNHTGPAKKREKVTQVLYWQSEVAELGDDALFCGCSVGTSTSYDTSDDGGGGGFTPVTQSRSQASSEAAMPRLSTVASGVTTVGTSAPGLDRSSTASPSSSLTAPSSSLSSSLSYSPPPGSPSCCSGCKKLLMPPRTLVFVSSSSDDFPWVRRSDDSGCGNSGLRKAIRAIRGLLGLSKWKRDKYDPKPKGLQNPDVAKIATSGGGNPLFFAVPDATGVQLVGPTSPFPSQHKKNIPEAKVWDLWENINCNELRDHVEKDEWDLFFPATEMYRGLRRHAEEGDDGSDKINADADADADAEAEAEADADVNIDDIINEDDEADDARAKERRRKREMAERLRRAQALLEQHK